MIFLSQSGLKLTGYICWPQPFNFISAEKGRLGMILFGQSDHRPSSACVIVTLFFHLPLILG